MDNNIDKKILRNNSFNKKLEELKNVTDRLNQKIENGVLIPVTYLNLLGFHTSASCEGHFENWAFPFGYIYFDSKTQSNPNSITNKIFSEVREEAFKKEKEKFPEYDGTLEKYSPEIDDYFDKNIKEGLDNHPSKELYLEEQSLITKEILEEKNKLDKLINEFKQYYPDHSEEIFSSSELKFPNIYFTSKDFFKIDKQYTEEERRKIKNRSDCVLKKFTDFLKLKYENHL